MKPYLTINQALQKRFGCRVYKVSIDGGFSCPNRDGTKGMNGCIFCDEKGSSARTGALSDSITTQVLRNIAVRKNRYKAKKFIAYFQSFTNTYAPLDILKKRYDEAINAHEDIVGLTISTRADCITSEIVDLIASYKSKLPWVSIELGAQTIHNKTLKLINRKETHEDFVRALQLIQNADLEHCIHVILGLPQETNEDMIQTAKKLTQYRIRGIKIHILVAMENTVLAKQYDSGMWQPLSMEEAISLCADFLKHLPPDCIIYRVGGNGHPLHGVAPNWVWKEKNVFQTLLIQELKKKNFPKYELPK